MNQETLNANCIFFFLQSWHYPWKWWKCCIRYFSVVFPIFLGIYLHNGRTQENNPYNHTSSIITLLPLGSVCKLPYSWIQWPGSQSFFVDPLQISAEELRLKESSTNILSSHSRNCSTELAHQGLAYQGHVTGMWIRVEWELWPYSGSLGCWFLNWTRLLAWLSPCLFFCLSSFLPIKSSFACSFLRWPWYALSRHTCAWIMCVSERISYYANCTSDPRPDLGLTLLSGRLPHSISPGQDRQVVVSHA